MTRTHLFLLMAVIASALVLVRTAHDTRRLVHEKHRADVEATRLADDFKRLEAERQLQATNLRVERTARERLKMSTATPAITRYEPPAVVAAVAGSVAAPSPKRAAP
jgi:cell division protein FtsL